MQFSPLLAQLIEALRCLPGVGPKTAQRMAFYLLTRHRDSGLHLATILQEAMQNIHYCNRCRLLSETALCKICASSNREPALLCIVENAIDVSAIEQTGRYKGMYFVLHGHLSPLDGIGPQEIGIGQLQSLFAEQTIQEVILATNPTVVGEATAHYISELAKSHGITVSRIARGIQIGGELEYTDMDTLAHAFAGREIV
jgi:recombination protein RecR